MGGGGGGRESPISEEMSGNENADEKSSILFPFFLSLSPLSFCVYAQDCVVRVRLAPPVGSGEERKEEEDSLVLASLCVEEVEF